jgi:hypothetical protein
MHPSPDTTVSGSDARRQDEQPDSFHRALSTTSAVQGLDAAGAALPSAAVTLPLSDAQMLLAWMDETFGDDSGTDWQDEDAAAVADALNKAVENFKRMRAAYGVALPRKDQP